MDIWVLPSRYMYSYPYSLIGRDWNLGILLHLHHKMEGSFGLQCLEIFVVKPLSLYIHDQHEILYRFCRVRLSICWNRDRTRTIKDTPFKRGTDIDTYSRSCIYIATRLGITRIYRHLVKSFVDSTWKLNFNVRWEDRIVHI